MTWSKSAIACSVFTEHLVGGAALEIVVGAGLQLHGTVEILERLLRIAALPIRRAAQVIRRGLLRIHARWPAGVGDRGLKIFSSR